MKKGKSAGANRTTANKASPGVLPEWPNNDWMDWMEWNGSSTIDTKGNHWSTFVERWRNLWTPNSTAVEVEKFLRSYAHPASYDQRLKAGWSKEYVEVRNAILEPLGMALGTPENPAAPAWPMLKPGDPAPSQADYDRRLATWLRAVIIDKDITALKHLITALEKTPRLYVGITEDEITSAILGDTSVQKDEAPRLKRTLFEFLEFLLVQRRLPAKAELRGLVGLAGDEHKTNFSGYLKALGLSGLPSKAKERNRFVTRKRKPLRTQKK